MENNSKALIQASGIRIGNAKAAGNDKRIPLARPVRQRSFPFIARLF
jgi:hypothetical protein